MVTGYMCSPEGLKLMVVFDLWTGILLVELDNLPAGPRKKKTLGEIVVK